MSKARYSPTQIAMFLRCPEQYRRRYILGDKRPPGIALIFGTAIHVGAALNYNTRIETQKPITLDEFFDAAKDSINLRIDEDGVEIEKGKKKKDVIGETIDKTKIIGEKFLNEISPTVDPAAVEEGILLVGKEYDMYGIMDLRTVDGWVDDLKTASSMLNQHNADTSIQLSHYALSYRVKFGKLPVGVRLSVVTKTKNPKTAIIRSQRAKRDIEKYLLTVDVVHASIKTGLFPPSSERNNLCNPLYCGYWSDCKYK